MRLHRLEVSAFGPFAGTERVDFDSLSSAGLFLLCGPTGGGKTSVLDAVSFALFGQVPGERDKAKSLHSDHAPAGAGPRVVLEVTLRARRMRITRSPEWTRPKKRGSGVTKEPAKVLLEEHVDGHWRQHTNRIDEAADLLGDLIGMTAGQFCQVALLPQGRFETFLRAGSQERHSLLERLFGAHRFRAIEEWLVDRRTALGRTSAEHESAIGIVIARVTEASGQQPPSDDAGRVVPDQTLIAWSAQVRDTLVDALVSARSEQADADLALKRARAQRDEARALAELQARHTDALARAERLSALAEETHQLSEQIATARRAQAMHPVVELYGESVERAQSARQRVLSCLGADSPGLSAGLAADLRERVAELVVHDSPTQWCDDALVEAAAAARTETARLTALTPTQAELDDVTSRLALAVDDVRDQVARQQRAQASHATLTERRAQAQRDLTAQQSAAHDVEALRQQLRTAQTRRAAARLAEETERRRREILASVSQATEKALAARASWLDARQRRLDGMAGELAAGLSDDVPCPVCGACAHPAPAATTPAQVTADDEHHAEEQFRDLDQLRARLAQQLHRCETEVATAVAGAGGLDLTAATEAYEHTAAELERATQARAETEACTEQLRRLESELADAAALVAAVDTELATHRERREQLQARHDQLRRTLDLAIGTTTGLPERLTEAQTAERATTELAEAVTGWRGACAELASRGRRLDQALRSHGFADLTEVGSSMLSSTGISDLEALLAERAAEDRQVHELLDDPAVRAAAAAPAVDVAALEPRLAALEQRRDAAVATQSELARQADRLERLHSELDAALAAWQPVREAHRTAASLAALCTGTSADNPDRVRLSSYVLAARLSQVVDAANERLDRMTAGRYLLEHSAARGVGDRRGGLGLRVCDGWTGASRDPATLSGGETFIASLGLALGLADVVAYEAGGVELGTLFVDEGFGTLDADSLDEVMDVLDSLRSGGRVVGLVSHVAELRARITSQVQVAKTRTGSTLGQV